MTRCQFLFLIILSALMAAAQTPPTLVTGEQSTPVKPAVPSESVVPRIQPFGYDYFQRGLPEAGLLGAGGLTDDYRLGAGDQLRILLGGKVQENFETIISADGQVFIPTAGVLKATGLTVAEFKIKLQEKLIKLYQSYTLDIMLTAPKLIRIAVSGEVREPGQYTITALSSVLDALSLAKGPTDIGSLRDIRVYRNNRLVLEIDLYDYLLKPTSTSYGQLQSGDLVFVPICRKRVQVIGQVFRPAIYEINPNRPERFSQLIEMAGGLTDFGYREKIEYSQMDAAGEHQAQYLTLPADSTHPETDPVLQNNDRIQVFSSLDQHPRKTVFIFGEVNHPGEYEFEQNMRVSDLILKAGYLTRSALLLKAQLAQVEPMRPAKMIDLDLEGLLQQPDGEKDLALDTDDQVFIRKIPEWQVGPMVEVRGEAVFPGFYPIVKDSTTLADVLTRAGSFNKEALIGETKLIRRREPMVEDKEFQRLKSMTRDQMSNMEYEYLVMKQNTADVSEIVVDFNRLMNLHDRSQDVVLQDGDVIIIPKTPRVVLVTGRVSKPGGVVFRENADLEYYIKQAGGFTWDADGGRTKVIQVTGEIKDDEDVDRFSPGDRIWVPRKADHNYWQIFRDIMMVAGQVATMYLVIHTATKK